jgi:hypothetical protein
VVFGPNLMRGWSVRTSGQHTVNTSCTTSPHIASPKAQGEAKKLASVNPSACAGTPHIYRPRCAKEIKNSLGMAGVLIWAILPISSSDMPFCRACCMLPLLDPLMVWPAYMPASLLCFCTLILRSLEGISFSPDPVLLSVSTLARKIGDGVVLYLNGPMEVPVQGESLCSIAQLDYAHEVAVRNHSSCVMPQRESH